MKMSIFGENDIPNKNWNNKSFSSKILINEINSDTIIKKSSGDKYV